MRAFVAFMMVGLLCSGALTKAAIITVDCEGGGDYTNLPDAMWVAGASDTVLVYPCTYFVTSSVWGWPITLDSDSPTFVGRDGAAVTILEGDMTTSAFMIEEAYYDARIVMRGFTFRNMTTVIGKVWPSGGGYIEFTDNVIEDCAHGLDAAQAPGSSIVARNVIRSNGSTGIGIYHNSGVIESNQICYNQGCGIQGVCCEEPRIRHNHIHHNVYSGISTGFFANIQYNIIEHNGGPGILFTGVDGPPIAHNIVRGNNVGLYLVSDDRQSVHYNDVYDNVVHDFECAPYVEGTELDATLNWWGTIDPEEIREHIWDCLDDPEIQCCVLFDPWCTEPGCGPSSVRAQSWGAIKALFR